MADQDDCYGCGHAPHAKGECADLVKFTLRRCLCPVASETAKATVAV